MKIIAHTKYGVFEGVENEYDEKKYAEIEKFLEKIHKLEYFCLMTDKGQIYFASQMIADTLFVFEK